MCVHAHGSQVGGEPKGGQARSSSLESTETQEVLKERDRLDTPKNTLNVLELGLGKKCLYIQVEEAKVCSSVFRKSVT